MSELGKIIDDIDWKVRQLVADKKSLKEKLIEKDKEISLLQSQVMDLVNENRILKEEKQTNNLTNIINNNSDFAESKKLINDLLKKINRSISIISRDNE